MQKIADDLINLTGAPDVPGLRFRHFRGGSDYAHIVAVIKASKEIDDLEWAISVEDTARDYKNLVNSDPYKDIIIAEVDREVVGYSRCWWDEQLDGNRTYSHFAYTKPSWRSAGIREAIMRWNEQRLRYIATTHPDCEKALTCWVSETEIHWVSILVKAGYKGVRYGFDMVRPNLDNIPDLPLPTGLELRPANMETWPTIFRAAGEAFRDHWEASEWKDEEMKRWEVDPMFNPALWQVAWDGDEVAGGVLTFINEKENEEYGRLRGYTETIFTRRPYRRQGLARALIARSLQKQKELGMTESALSVDAENPNGALRLYQSMGFEETKRTTTYRKPLA
ncbi:MAG: GNAT family N-acetyltransferase [Chloroflexi bacterium]|nr:GNAT family N-acetyltransferase [Chloroflexota bacterium]